jgi:rRNA biogenesis protein RRP5
LRRGDLEQARQLLPRSLQSLEKRKRGYLLVMTCSLTHISKDLKTISKFAQLEYKLGEPERGRTIFEGIVDSHSKRCDIWSVYMDMEAGQGDIQHLRYVLTYDLLPYSKLMRNRNLFDRVLALRMSSHKAKYVPVLDVSPVYLHAVDHSLRNGCSSNRSLARQKVKKM